ncbi:hypothetical protein [Pseudarthrobacter sp. H2]|uniref:hypothetical protein n=1 Tax=Pseudarthrobacter sp. H2 TaxID=3418415 RepID=UPI003CE7A477
MRNIGQLAAGALLVLALSACTGGTPDPPGTPASGAAVNLETGTDVGNGRPAVSHDGLMVRRRVVIAVHPTPEADLASLRSQLDRAAAERGITLSDVSPDVLDEAVLEQLDPGLTVSLPPERTREDAGALTDRAFGRVGSFTGVDSVHIGSVLVHDLQFAVPSSDPASLAAAIETEGILADALGNYTTSMDSGTLGVAYTGPLLSDALVESVRAGMARDAGVEPGDVKLNPRSTSGEGVDLSREPAPESGESKASPGHQGGH